MTAISIDDDLVHYEPLGRGRPVVLLHDFLGSWMYWIPTIQNLQQNYRLYALDFYGFGDTAKNPAKFGLDAQVALLDAFMTQMGLQKAAVIGHGMGAAVAAAFARRFPDRVARLLLVSAPLFDPGDLAQRKPAPTAARSTSAPPNTPTTSTASSGVAPAAGGTAAMRAALLEAARARSGAATVAPSMPMTPVTVTPAAQTSSPSPTTVAAANTHNPLRDLVVQGVENLVGRCFKRGERNYERMLAETQRADARAAPSLVAAFDSGTMLDTLRVLPMPTGLIHGADDPVMPMPSEAVLNYMTAEPDRVLVPVLLPNVRHFPMLEDDRFFRLVSDFLEAPDISRIEVKERWRRRTR